jgi:two-component system nitrate/nitrite response regulator NarL
VAGIFLSRRRAELTAAICVAAGGTGGYDRPAVRDPSASAPVFNERQRKVLRFVLEGLANKEIAWRLQISESYVKAILQSLFQKTGVRTRGQLVRVAFEQYEDQL